MIDRIANARALLMREARTQDERGDTATHAVLMSVVAALDDADRSRADFQFIRHRIEHQHDDDSDRDRQRERLRLVRGEEAEEEERRKVGL